MGDVTDIRQWKRDRDGRGCLVVDRGSGLITGRTREIPDFDDRLTRIRASLEKINRLMASLKQMSAQAEIDHNERLRREEEV